jgi:hypothetical protein
MKKRKTAEETVFGGRIDFVEENILRIGVLHYRSRFSNSFQPKSVFDIRGKEFNYTSAAYDILGHQSVGCERAAGPNGRDRPGHARLLAGDLD